MTELLICGLATFISILIIFFHERVIQYRIRPPQWLSHRIASNSKDAKENEETNKATEKKSTVEDSIISKNLVEFERVLVIIRNRIEKEDDEKKLFEQWKSIFNYVDLVCLVIFLCIQAIATVYFLH